MRLVERIALSATVMAAALTSVARVARAQSSFDEPPVGARIRIARSGVAPMTGTVLSRATDSIVVGWTDGGREAVAMKDVTGLETSRGRSRNVIVGTALGIVAGTAMGVALKRQSGGQVRIITASFKSTDPNNLYLQAAAVADTSRGNAARIPLGAIAGAAGGTLVGYVWKERWRPAPIRRGDARLGIVSTPDARRVALSLSARF
jgi:hypothetical protein